MLTANISVANKIQQIFIDNRNICYMSILDHSNGVITSRGIGVTKNIVIDTIRELYNELNYSFIESIDDGQHL